MEKDIYISCIVKWKGQDINISTCDCGHEHTKSAKHTARKDVFYVVKWEPMAQEE